MNTILVLKLLLSFCDGTDYQFLCRSNIRACFVGSMQSHLSNEEAFRVCLDENYTDIYDGKYSK